mmetsp:Transcript_8599/g.14941  ORF Transcript_8599/g.14941 Transcript_8599/m.14941 type:complete len:111 (-) Transcript_8599:65-397(-)
MAVIVSCIYNGLSEFMSIPEASSSARMRIMLEYSPCCRAMLVVANTRHRHTKKTSNYGQRRFGIGCRYEYQHQCVDVRYRYQQRSSADYTESYYQYSTNLATCEHSGNEI